MDLEMTNIACLVALLALSFSSVSPGEELVRIGTIVTHATSLALHLVTFQGTVTELESRLAFPTRGCWSFYRSKVVIEDETGTIDAMLCGDPVDSTGNIVEGDHARISAVIDVLSSEAVRPPIQARVQRIERITSQP